MQLQELIGKTAVMNTAWDQSLNDADKIETLEGEAKTLGSRIVSSLITETKLTERRAHVFKVVLSVLKGIDPIDWVSADVEKCLEYLKRISKTPLLHGAFAEHLKDYVDMFEICPR